MTRQDIQDAFDRLKARVSFGGDSTGATAGIETVRENLPAVLKLVAAVLRSPTFPASEFEQLKNERITAIESQRKEPNAVARNALARHGSPYPKGHVRHEDDFDEAIAGVKSIKSATVRPCPS